MESLLGLLGVLFFMFLVLAATVEAVLEVFRGLLERVGITWAKGKVTLDEALKLASEFAPDHADLNTKLQAVKSTAEQLKHTAKDKIKSLEVIKGKLQAAGANTSEIAGELNDLAASVKSDLEQSERRRVFVLRLIAAIVGCFLAYQADFYVFRMLAQTPGSKELLAGLSGLQEAWINILVGGLATAAGSSYWHDQLDKIRNLKSAYKTSGNWRHRHG